MKGLVEKVNILFFGSLEINITAEENREAKARQVLCIVICISMEFHCFIKSNQFVKSKAALKHIKSVNTYLFLRRQDKGSCKCIFEL